MRQLKDWYYGTRTTLGKNYAFVSTEFLDWSSNKVWVLCGSFGLGNAAVPMNTALPLKKMDLLADFPMFWVKDYLFLHLGGQRSIFLKEEDKWLNIFLGVDILPCVWVFILHVYLWLNWLGLIFYRLKNTQTLVWFWLQPNFVFQYNW